MNFDSYELSRMCLRSHGFFKLITLILVYWAYWLAYFGLIWLYWFTTFTSDSLVTPSDSWEFLVIASDSLVIPTNPRLENFLVGYLESS